MSDAECQEQVFALQSGVVLLARMPGEALGDSQENLQRNGADHCLSQPGGAETSGEGGIEGHRGG